MESPKVLPSGHARQRAERGRAGAWWRWLRVRVGFAVQNLGRVARGFDSLQVLRGSMEYFSLPVAPAP